MCWLGDASCHDENMQGIVGHMWPRAWSAVVSGQAALRALVLFAVVRRCCVT